MHDEAKEPWSQSIVYLLYGTFYSGILTTNQDIGAEGAEVCIVSTDRRVSKQIQNIVLSQGELIKVPEGLLSGKQSIDDFLSAADLPDSVKSLLRSQIENIKWKYHPPSQDDVQSVKYA